MPIRDKFPAEYFEGNPFEGNTPHQTYKRLQWGNNPRRTYKLEAPEPMVVLGRLAQLIYAGRGKQSFRDGKMYVAVGNRSNRVYLVPIASDGGPLDFPVDFLRHCEPIVRLRRIDYYSEKGGEDGYYYHDHEKPYPMIYGYGSHFVIEPAPNGNGRSYAVGEEGIIG